MIRVFAVVAVAVAVLLVSGCGGDDDGDAAGGGETAPEAWADELCSSITTWRSSMSALAGTVTQGGLSRETLEDAVNDAKSATEQLADDLRGLGAPDTEAGEQAKESIDEAASGLNDDIATIESAVDDASDGGGILDAVSVVSATLAAMGERVSTTVSEVRGLDAAGELQEAFEQASSCDDLR